MARRPVQLEMLTPAGQVIDTVQLGAQGTGLQNFTWPPTTAPDTSSVPHHRDATNTSPAMLFARDRVDAVSNAGAARCCARPPGHDRLRPSVLSVDSLSLTKTPPMSFQQGLSGLNAAAKSLDIIGNNIANSATYGSKGSRAEFSDVYAAALNGAGLNSVGIGTTLAAVSQQFTQGNISTTDNPWTSPSMAVASSGDRWRQPNALHPQQPVQDQPRGLHRQQRRP